MRHRRVALPILTYPEQSSDLIARHTAFLRLHPVTIARYGRPNIAYRRQTALACPEHGSIWWP
jgi:hypothetical protein